MSQNKFTPGDFANVFAFPLGGLLGAILTVSLDQTLADVAQNSTALRSVVLIMIGFVSLVFWQAMPPRRSQAEDQSGPPRLSAKRLFARSALGVCGSSLLLFGFVSLLIPEARPVLEILTNSHGV